MTTFAVSWVYQCLSHQCLPRLKDSHLSRWESLNRHRKSIDETSPEETSLSACYIQHLKTWYQDMIWAAYGHMKRLEIECHRAGESQIKQYFSDIIAKMSHLSLDFSSLLLARLLNELTWPLSILHYNIWSSLKMIYLYLHLSCLLSNWCLCRMAALSTLTHLPRRKTLICSEVSMRISFLDCICHIETGCSRQYRDQAV